jgi:hypothetical protein
VAFRRIPGIHLGISGYEGSHDGLDFTNLPNGDIVLSVMGISENNEFCMYQVLFDAIGRLKKPVTLEEVEPGLFPEDLSLPIIKIKSVKTDQEQDPAARERLIRHEYLLFGFDEGGNFYEAREIWDKE